MTSASDCSLCGAGTYLTGPGGVNCSQCGAGKYQSGLGMGSEGSCVGFSICQAIETTLTRNYGRRHWVSLSGMSLYKRIGRSAGSGAYIPDGIAQATQ